MAAITTTRAVFPLRWLLVRGYPFVLILLVWDRFSAIGLFGGPLTMPSPGQVLDSATQMFLSGELLRLLGITLRSVLVSCLIAVVVGVPLGLLIGRVRLVSLCLRPLVSLMFPVPKIALYPAMLTVFGLGVGSKIALGTAEALFPILIGSAAAASQIDDRLQWSALALGTGRARCLTKVILPAAMPGILTGARIGLIGAIIGVFLGEMMAGSGGLGEMTMTSYQTLRTADMYTGIVAISITGFVVDRAFLMARRRALAWNDAEDFASKS